MTVAGTPRTTYCNPVFEGYFADPYVLRVGEEYVAYGTGSAVEGRVFEILTSPDLVHWTSAGGALPVIDAAPVLPALGDGGEQARA